MSNTDNQNAQEQTEVLDTDNTNDDLPKVDELTALKSRADMMGVSYHPSIGLEKLREKINQIVTTDGPVTKEVMNELNPAVTLAAPAVLASAPAAEVPVEETIGQLRSRKKREANELIRIRVSCMNPAKKEWDGEIFTVSNAVVGTFSKFVPFDAEDGWHVPRIIYNQLVERKCQVFVSTKDGRGNSVRKGKLIREFAIEILPNLTAEEIAELARRQVIEPAN